MTYYRISNQLDVEMVAEKFAPEENILAERMKEIIRIWEDAYGKDKKAFAMGGYILYFPDKEAYQKSKERILDYYHLNPEYYEYRDIIGERAINGYLWLEELFLLSSDDAILFVYPEEEKDNAST